MAVIIGTTGNDSQNFSLNGTVEDEVPDQYCDWKHSQ
jgi:hypothetical protein